MVDKFKDLYANLINDVSDEDTREKFLDRLERICDDIAELDSDIEKELENQYVCEAQSYYDLENEFNYSNRMPM